MGSDWQSRGKKTWQGAPRSGKAKSETKPGEVWQEGSAGPQRRVDTHRRRESLWAIYSLVAAGLLGLLLYFLLNIPRLTPVILVLGTDYDEPIRPNSWVREDANALGAARGTLLLEEVKGRWANDQPRKSEAFTKLTEYLDKHKRSRRGFHVVRQPVIVYVSMPGVVNEKNEPCLLPPDVPGAAWDSSKWITVESIIDVMNDTVKDRPKILVLDSSQELANWQLGIIYNTFGDRLKDYCGENKERFSPNDLVIITSAGPGEVSWASPGLGGTAFGKFLQLGLAGDADRNDDQEVSRNELAKYLEQQVDKWAIANRASRQRPAMYGGDPDRDHIVTHVIGESELNELRKRNPSAIDEPAVSTREIELLWKSLAKTRDAELLRLDPIALSHFEHQLLRLEQLAIGGSEYTAQATQLYEALKKAFEDIDTRSQIMGTAIANHWRLADPKKSGVARLDGLPSIPLCKYFGDETATTFYTGNVASETAVAVLWQQIKGVDTQAANDSFEPKFVKFAASLETTQFLMAARQRGLLERSETAQWVVKAQDLREAGDMLGVPISDGKPADERAHYVVRQLLKAADVKRRMAEDDLFVGRIPSTESWNLIDRDYDVARRAGTNLANALRVRDTTCAELPYLVAWHLLAATSPDGQTFEQNKLDLERIRSDNDSLAQGVRNLLESLDASDSLDRQATELNEDIAQQIEENRSRLVLDFQTSCDNLASGGTQATGAELLVRLKALESPHIRGESAAGTDSQTTRRRLFDKALQFDKQLNDDFLFAADMPSGEKSALPGRPDESDKPAAQPLPSRNLAQIADTGLVDIVLGMVAAKPIDRTDSNTSRQISRLRTANEHFRNRLIELAKNHASSNDTRVELSQAEYGARCAASIVDTRPSSDDAISRLRRFDLQALLLFHADRLRNGFWATVTPQRARSIDDFISSEPRRSEGEEEFYYISTKTCLDAVSQIDKSPPDAVDGELEVELQRLKEFLQAAKEGVKMRGSTAPIPGFANDVNVTLAFGPNSLPTGRASLRIEPTDTNTLAVEWQSNRAGFVDLPVPSEKVEIPAKANGVSSPNLVAKAYFRGHEYRDTFPVRSGKGALVSYAPPRYNGQSVTLLGEQPKPPSVVFVLDCSVSMKAEVPVENGMEPRIKVAKDALGELLNELADRSRKPSPRVGVYFFGHRLYWNTKTPYNVENNLEKNVKAAGGSIPADLVPANDVEQVLSLGRFGGQEYQRVRNRLANVTFFGMTPVNLSIIRALGEFQREDDSYAKSIVVITDGQNFQGHPDWAPGFNEKSNATTTKMVIEAWNTLNEKRPKEQQIPIYIVGFGIANSEVEDFKTIASHTGGQWLGTSDRGELIRFLRERIEFDGYVARQTNDNGSVTLLTKGSDGTERPIPLSTPQSVPGGPAELPAKVEVEYRNVKKVVRFEGGEALKLRVPRGTISIVDEPFREAEFARADLVGPDGPTTLRLRSHAIRHSADGVVFRFSLENQDLQSHFTPRPVEVWLEVTPKGTPLKYILYDRVFIADTSVPVIELDASGWPDDVSTAQVRFWCSEGSTSADATLKLKDVLSQGGKLTATLPDLPGTTVAIELSRTAEGDDYLVINEHHDGGTKPSDGLRVSLQIASKTLLPERVSHLFDDENKYARHEYTFSSGLAEDEFAGLVAVEVVSANKVKANGKRIGEEQGMEVTIPKNSATIAPSTIGNQ